VAAPDRAMSMAGFRRLELSACIATKLNRTHLLTGGESLLLPCLGRTEIDMQASGAQSVTVEDSMSMVHASRGFAQPGSPHLRSEPAIIAGIAKATLHGSVKVDWDALIGNYDLIRDKIEAVMRSCSQAITRGSANPAVSGFIIPPRSVSGTHPAARPISSASTALKKTKSMSTRRFCDSQRCDPMISTTPPSTGSMIATAASSAAATWST